MSQLEQLKAHTIVVADTGDVEAIKRIQPQDATTNPSLIYKAASMEQYANLVDEAIAYGEGDISKSMDKVAVNFGIDISRQVPGYVSTEVDARLSFDTEATIAKARDLIELYREAGIDKSRILIKIAATWEGIKAAEVLEKEGITCNLTLIFNIAQAIACAEAGCTLISPFVGRIMDWHKKDKGVDGFAPEEDPGVQSVTYIYNYYKKYGYKTIVMGASFRNVDEILMLTGCDRLTISPTLLDELAKSTDPVTKYLDADAAESMNNIEKIDMDKKIFRWMMSQDAMATQKLAEGIRGFGMHIESLEKILISKMPRSQLEQLKDHTIVVADTGDVEAIKRIQPQDATTNPSLIYKAASMEQYANLVDDAIVYGEGDISKMMDKVAVNFGIDISKQVPGYVSTEVDARLSFNTEKTIAKARDLIELYKEAGIDKSRILIKIAATWEGIKAAEVLEKEGITCNLTLIFNIAQAIACAEAGCTLISPFVGRIMDWHKKAKGVDGFAPEEDPGVQSVAYIYNYYKKYGYKTIVMGASFRNVDEIIMLTGCDRLTISPNLLDELAKSTDPLTKYLDADVAASKDDIEKIDMDEDTFRWMMNQDAMATEKLAEGIRGFGAHIESLEETLRSKM